VLSRVFVPSVWSRRIECINKVSDDETAYDLQHPVFQRQLRSPSGVELCVSAGMLAVEILLCL
jgi:hypothetical protein